MWHHITKPKVRKNSHAECLLRVLGQLFANLQPSRLPSTSLLVAVVCRNYPFHLSLQQIAPTVIC